MAREENKLLGRDRLDSNFIQWLVSQTGLAGIAGFALWQMGRTYDDREKHLIDSQKHDRETIDLLLATLRENTEAMTQLKATLEGVKEVVANCGLTQRYAARRDG